MQKIKTGDTVQVIAGGSAARGGDKGKQGRVLRRRGDRVLVEGINRVKRHRKVGQSQRGAKTGGIETVEDYIHVSNVALLDPESKKPTRVGFRAPSDPKATKGNGKPLKLVRYAKRSGKELP